MHKQNQIKQTLSKPENIEYIRNLLKKHEIGHRTELARRVCEQLAFKDTRGQAQISGCLKALRKLESAGHFTLPAANRKTAVPKTPRRLSSPLPLPVDVPPEVGDVQGLQLVLVHTSEEMRIWNELRIEEHPLGVGPLVGRQIRYLIHSQHGWLGGFGFAAAALHLGARDKWIGWDMEQRQAYLHFIVGMGRFLIRPSVQCRNLASKVLSMSMATLPDDFEQKYNYRPLLIESFVDDSHYSGTCYRAANWIEIGKTKGRGRQDCFSKKALHTKGIYMYPIEKNFREQMGLSPHAGLGALKPEDGLDGAQWAEHEFGGAALGDLRLTKRLVSVAAAKAEAPSRSFCGVAKGDWAATKAYYRLIDQPEASAVNMTSILAHETAERLRRAISINLVIAWRIMLMTLAGRETPELPADLLFSDIEIRTLKAYAKKKDLNLLCCKVMQYNL